MEPPYLKVLTKQAREKIDKEYNREIGIKAQELRETVNAIPVKEYTEIARNGQDRMLIKTYQNNCVKENMDNVLNRLENYKGFKFYSKEMDGYFGQQHCQVYMSWEE